MTVHFEGTEKALEVTVADGVPSLRSRPASFYRELVALADGTVLRRTVTPRVDAYLLAESSLFVSDRHLLMLTCGRTRVYRAAENLVGALGEGAITSLSLTRLGERFPDEQLTSLSEDVRLLGACIAGGLVAIGSKGPHAGGAFVHETFGRVRAPGETRLRVVGNDLDPEVARAFTGEPRPRQASVLAPILRCIGADATLDTFDFPPSGFSLNAVRGETTFAVHVTPEPEASYVSVVASEVSPGLLEATLSVFAPRTCLVTCDVPVALPSAYSTLLVSRAQMGDHGMHVLEGRRR